MKRLKFLSSKQYPTLKQALIKCVGRWPAAALRTSAASWLHEAGYTRDVSALMNAASGAASLPPGLQPDERFGQLGARIRCLQLAAKLGAETVGDLMVRLQLQRDAHVLVSKVASVLADRAVRADPARDGAAALAAIQADLDASERDRDDLGERVFGARALLRLIAKYGGARGGITLLDRAARALQVARLDNAECVARTLVALDRDHGLSVEVLAEVQALGSDVLQQVRQLLPEHLRQRVRIS